VTPRLVRTQHLVGTPDEICAKLRALAELGIRTFATVTYTVTDKAAAVREIGERIIRRFGA
jgi:alkanesulfonate monooxygenase SsuD/methylene tetrahydromethanopterin reductase-like flavin-dependent oxidoreductase (luciferase family)